MKKIVVAESSPTIKSVADSLLRQSGYDVVCTSDGLQAWEVISAEKPDLILAGLSLSGISGLELCRQVTSDRLTGGIPVVLMIGAHDTIREEEIVASGARGKLKKPFSPRDLLDVVNKLIVKIQYSGSVEEAARPKPTETKFVTQVSSTKHLQKEDETYNLDWLDLSEANAPKHISKVASFDLSNDDQALIIDDDQYGLANQILPEEEEPIPPPVPELPQDDDYEWFVGEMKRDMEGKLPDPTKKFQVKSSPQVEKPRVTQDIGFDDIRPSSADGIKAKPIGDLKMPRVSPDFGKISPFPSKTADADLQKQFSPPLAPKMSETEISSMADQIASRLAAQIASHIDREFIIEAIRSELKSR
jgi:CheY-like chemotaxis protein